MEIRPCSAAEILRHSELIAEYADECAINGMPRPEPSIELYERLETAGLLHCFGVYAGGCLVGFATIITNVVPHYNRVTAITESVFVSNAYRKSGVGLKLLKAIVEHSRRYKAVGLLISTPAGSRFSKLLARMGYSLTNEVYFRCLQ